MNDHLVDWIYGGGIICVFDAISDSLHFLFVYCQNLLIFTSRIAIHHSASTLADGQVSAFPDELSAGKVEDSW